MAFRIIPENRERKFWGHTSHEGDHLIYDGCPNGSGGHISTSWYGRRIYVHRIAWMLYNDREVPIGMNVLHSCDVPACVKREHLFLGTQADNIHDMDSKNRGNHWGRQ